MNGLRKLGRAFRADGGNVAVIMALSMAPLGIATLGALDLHRATSAKVQLQDALDAAALGAAHSKSTTDAELQTAGARFLGQNLSLDPEIQLTTSSFRFGDQGKVLASASIRVVPYVAGLITGDGQMDISASAEVKRADTKLEIALVLDNTGSMQGSKLTNLKTAATNFITTMQAAAAKSAESDAVKISLVPFSQTVRVGSTYRYQTWLDQTGAAPVNDEIFTTSTGNQHANRFTLLTQLGTSWGGCVETRQAPYDIQDTAPTTGSSLFTPYFAPDEPDSTFDNDYDNNYVPDKTNSSNWRVRQGAINKYVSTGGLGTSLGPNRGCSLTDLRRLTTDYAGLKSGISSMVATGNTNIPLGLAWGWLTLSPKAPFGDGSEYLAAKHKKIVVLMTDGENLIDDKSDTANRSNYSGVGYVWQGRIIKADNTPLVETSESVRTAALDSRLTKLCQNMKAANVDIEIYTIRVEVTSGSSAVLSGCATDADHFYDVQNASQLNAVFNAIAGQIANLHLAR